MNLKSTLQAWEDNYNPTEQANIRRATMNNAAISHILPAQSPLSRYAPLFAKSLQTTALAGFITLTLISATNGASFPGNLKGVTISDAQATNKAPIAAFTYTNNGTTFTFNASGSSDPDGSITEYQWDFGNGTKGNGATVNTNYTPGNYPVTLTVIDNAKGVALAQQSITYTEGLVLENAEDGTTSGWSIYDNDPTGATISNIYDGTKKSKVIYLAGQNTSNGFSFVNNDGTPLGITDKFTVKFTLKSTSEFNLYFKVSTKSGIRYLTYTNSDISTLGSSSYVYYGLGKTSIDGNWNSLSRNLQSDLTNAQPENTIISIDSIMIRGNMLIDDISFQ